MSTESQVAPQMRNGISFSGLPGRFRRRAGSGSRRAGKVILPVHESDNDAQMPSLM
jgi:hypothetical protein